MKFWPTQYICVCVCVCVCVWLLKLKSLEFVTSNPVHTSCWPTNPVNCAFNRKWESSHLPPPSPWPESQASRRSIIEATSYIPNSTLAFYNLISPATRGALKRIHITPLAAHYPLVTSISFKVKVKPSWPVRPMLMGPLLHLWLLFLYSLCSGHTGLFAVSWTVWSTNPTSPAQSFFMTFPEPTRLFAHVLMVCLLAFFLSQFKCLHIPEAFSSHVLNSQNKNKFMKGTPYPFYSA